jgi:hypothetical protein
MRVINRYELRAGVFSPKPYPGPSFYFRLRSAMGFGYYRCRKLDSLTYREW